MLPHAVNNGRVRLVKEGQRKAARAKSLHESIPLRLSPCVTVGCICPKILPGRMGFRFPAFPRPECMKQPWNCHELLTFQPR